MFCFEYPVYTKTFENLVKGLVLPALIHIYPRCERSWSLIALRSPRNTRFEDVVSILNATLKLAVSSTLSNKVVRLALSKALSFYTVKPTNKALSSNVLVYTGYCKVASRSTSCLVSCLDLQRPQSLKQERTFPNYKMTF